MAENTATADKIAGLLDREIWIVTSAHAGKRGGLCATWVSPAFLDPNQPTMLAALAPNHFTTELVEASGGFVAHLVRIDQTALAINFAIGSGRDRDKFAAVATVTGRVGMPQLADCVAWLECQVTDRYARGDRTYFWAEVVASRQFSTNSPLRESQLIAAASPEERAALAANRMADIEIQRPLLAAWRHRQFGLQ